MASEDTPSENPSNPEKEQFLYPLSSYQGKFTPEQLIFNANLQEFAQRVSILCALETGGKIEPEQTYHEIKQLWKALRNSKRNLLDQERPDPPDLPEDEPFDLPQYDGTGLDLEEPSPEQAPPSDSAADPESDPPETPDPENPNNDTRSS